jgi:hypothetical protein
MSNQVPIAEYQEIPGRMGEYSKVTIDGKTIEVGETYTMKNGTQFKIQSIYQGLLLPMVKCTMIDAPNPKFAERPIQLHAFISML